MKKLQGLRNLPMTGANAPELPIVETDITDPVITDEEALAALKRQGLVGLTSRHLEDMKALGVHTAGLGIIRTQKGQAMINQHRLNYGMRLMLVLLGKVVAKTRDKDQVTKACQIGHVLGYIGSKLTESQKLLLEGDTTRAKGGRHSRMIDDSPPTRSGFVPGTNVQPGTLVMANEVHMHAQKEKETPP